MDAGNVRRVQSLGASNGHSPEVGYWQEPGVASLLVAGFDPGGDGSDCSPPRWCGAGSDIRGAIGSGRGPADAAGRFLGSGPPDWPVLVRLVLALAALLAPRAVVLAAPVLAILALVLLEVATLERSIGHLLQERNGDAPRLT